MLLTPVISTLLSYLLALMAMAFYTLMERKFLGYFQLRKGPNKPSLMGLPQPFADAIKLFVKEQAKPTMSNNILFMAAPALSLTLAMMMWVLYPHQYQAMFMPLGILYFLCVSSMNVYPTFMAGWCSNSKYALLGSLRGVAQTISYEVTMALILISALLILSNLDITMISVYQYSWVTLMFFPLMMMWFITTLAETNRTPFDFAEGESELVSGFNTEYSSGLFAMIFMAEYTNILMMSMVSAALFCGTFMIYSPLASMFLVLKTMLFATLFVWVRATMPRMRYDHLMYLTWKSFLPVVISVFMLILPIMMMM
nr:NADH dehydrogenase subunit 1 [Nais communis]